MVIGARGTNEAPTADWQTLNAYASDQYLGVGQTVDKVYTQLKAQNPGLVFSLEPAVYQTALPSLDTPLTQVLHDIKKYLGDAAAGGANIAEDVLDTDLACPGGRVHYVLVGYSLGAWAIHDALTLLSAQLNEISGVALFGDPKYTPGQPYDAQQDQYAGIATGQPGDNNIPKILQPHTVSWCLPADGICQAIGVPAATLANELAPCIAGAPPLLCAHFQYATNGDTSAAAAFLSPLLPQLKPPGDFQWTTSIAGTTGSFMPLPANAGSARAAYLDSVACPSTGSCVAVGSYMDSSGYWQALIETLAGGSWEATEVTGPFAESDTNASLYSVACPSTSSCVAVGEYNNSTSALLVTGSGTSWTSTEAPLPGDAQSGATADLFSVTCPSATSCVAVGEYNNIPNSGTASGLILTGPASSGTLWTPTHAPLPPNALSVFSGEWPAVACMSATSCVTTWTYNNSSGTQQGALDTGSGTNWTPSELPLPGDASTSNPEFILGSNENGTGQPLACSSASCVAVGHYVDSSGNIQSLLVTGSGTNWTQTEAPLPANASGRVAVLYSVACESATTCVAAGRYSTSSGTQGLILTGSGTSWTPAAAPVPANAVTPLQVGLDSVTCPSTSWCVIAGSYATAATGGGQTVAGLAVIGSGTSWNTTLAPLPGNAYSFTTYLNSLACPSTTSCVSVGQYSDGTNLHGLLATGAP